MNSDDIFNILSLHSESIVKSLTKMGLPPEKFFIVPVVLVSSYHENSGVYIVGNSTNTDHTKMALEMALNAIEDKDSEHTTIPDTQKPRIH